MHSRPEQNLLQTMLKRNFINSIEHPVHQLILEVLDEELELLGYVVIDRILNGVVRSMVSTHKIDKGLIPA